jgi:hypothetical protein
MRITRILMVSAAMTLAAGNLQAQTNTASCNQTAKADFNTTPCAVTNSIAAVVPYLATVNHTTSSVQLPAATVASMDAGVSASVSGPTLAVQSNFAYTITATSGGFAANGSYTKAKADLEIATDDQATAFAPLVDAGVVVAGASSTTNTPTNSRSLPLYFRVKYSWVKDLPGTYSATVTYTLTAP